MSCCIEIYVLLTIFVSLQYYRALYEKNVRFLHKNKSKALDGPSLSNLAMQLRKCCNHPFLLNGVEEDVRAQVGESGEKLSEGDFLVKASGKLVLLDKLLPRLKADGHRVLIFSQFKVRRMKLLLFLISMTRLPTLPYCYRSCWTFLKITSLPVK